LVIGATYGVFFREGITNTALMVVFGALGGIFLGWFAAIIAQIKYGANSE
jgi:hypothetical protein